MAAVEAFLGGAPAGRHEAPEPRRARRGLGAGALALGVVVGIGARAVYRRARDFDLEQAARAVERRIMN
jgi:hypothetical protein